MTDLLEKNYSQIKDRITNRVKEDGLTWNQLDDEYIKFCQSSLRFDGNNNGSMTMVQKALNPVVSYILDDSNYLAQKGFLKKYAIDPIEKGFLPFTVESTVKGRKNISKLEERFKELNIGFEVLGFFNQLALKFFSNLLCPYEHCIYKDIDTYFINHYSGIEGKSFVELYEAARLSFQISNPEDTAKRSYNEILGQFKSAYFHYYDTFLNHSFEVKKERFFVSVGYVYSGPVDKDQIRAMLYKEMKSIDSEIKILDLVYTDNYHHANSLPNIAKAQIYINDYFSLCIEAFGIVIDDETKDKTKFYFARMLAGILLSKKSSWASIKISTSEMNQIALELYRCFKFIIDNVPNKMNEHTSSKSIYRQCENIRNDPRNEFEFILYFAVLKANTMKMNGKHHQSNVPHIDLLSHFKKLDISSIIKSLNLT